MLCPLLSLASAALFLFPTAAAPAQATPEYFFTFGDSYSQTGFNITFEKPSAANPLGNPTYPGWTTSGGPNWLGYLTAKYNASTIYTYNFAYGGATVDASIIAPFDPSVLSLIDQVAIFSNSVASKPSYAQWTSADSTFAVWIGINDIGQSWWLEDETVRLGKVLDQYFIQVETLYKAGARKFAFLTVPPVTRAPAVLGNSGVSLWAQVIVTFNSALSTRVSNFTATHPGTTARLVDTRGPFDEALDNPTKYGATNATCYSADGLTCLWFNDYHPAIAIHELVAKEFARVVGAPFKL